MHIEILFVTCVHFLLRPYVIYVFAIPQILQFSLEWNSTLKRHFEGVTTQLFDELFESALGCLRGLKLLVSTSYIRRFGGKDVLMRKRNKLTLLLAMQ